MKFFLLLLIILSSMSSFAQWYDLRLPPTQNAPGVKWKTIDTAHYELVFDEELTEDAKRVADVLEATFKATADSLKQEPTKISIFLFNQATDANGMVALAPRRSEWYTTPPGSNAIFGNVHWLDLLTIHEMRHVVQFDKSKQGFTKAMYVVLGEFGWAIASHFAIPFWVWEGDAVGTETALSQGGRGRLPNFELGIRTILLNDKLYSYEKAYLGSFQDYYPNHYPLGYLLTTYIKNKFGLSAFEQIFTDASRKSYNPFALDNALMRITGRGLHDTYRDCMMELKTRWQEQVSKLQITSAEKVAISKNDGWTNYEYPMLDEAGNLYAIKAGLGQIPTLIKIENGKEEELHIPGYLFDNPLNISKNKIIWNESRFDLRFGQRNYSVLQEFDLTTKKARQLTNKTRYFSPVYSPDETQIAVIENGLKLDRSLVILNAKTIHVEKRFVLEKETYYFTPYFFPDGKSVVVVKQDKAGQSLVKVSLSDGQTQVLYGPTAYTISRPIIKDNEIFFNSHKNGLDNIWALNLTTLKASQVTSRTLGAYNAFVHQNKLFYSDYSFDGMQIVSADLKPDSWIPEEKVQDTNILFYAPMAQAENKPDVLKNVPSLEHKVGSYNHFSDLFNAHSWLVFPNPFGNTLDVAIVTTNKLSTFGSQLGYQYNGNEDTSRAYSQLSYAGLFPIIDASVSYGGRQSTTSINGVNRAYEWKEQKASLDLRIPFNFTQDSYTHTLELISGPSFTKIHDKTFREPFDLNNGTMTSIDSRIRYHHSKRMSLRDIYPEFGQLAQFIYKKTPGEDFKGEQISINTFFYFRGLMKHHSLWFNLAYEKQKPANYRYETEFLLPRGYEFLYKNEYQKASTNYTYPVVMLDKNFGQIINFKRLKQNVFYDHGRGQEAGNIYYNSVGTELTLDTNILNIKLPLDIGVRAAYTLNTKKWDIVPTFFTVAMDF